MLPCLFFSAADTSSLLCRLSESNKKHKVSFVYKHKLYSNSIGFVNSFMIYLEYKKESFTISPPSLHTLSVKVGDDGGSNSGSGSGISRNQDENHSHLG